MESQQPEQTDLPKNDPPENPASTPNPIAVVLELNEDDLARVRRWAQHSPDKSIHATVKDGKLHLKGIDPEKLWWRIEMFETFGVDESHVQRYLDAQIMGNLRAAAPGQEVTPNQQQTARRTAWAMMRGIGPRDYVEAMLAVQMITVHNLAVEMMSQALQAENPEARRKWANEAIKLLRTFPVQMEALKKGRNGGQQKVTVEHVHVNQGGQSMIGNFEAGGRGK
jgi:hypothetical protein